MYYTVLNKKLKSISSCLHNWFLYPILVWKKLSHSCSEKPNNNLNKFYTVKIKYLVHNFTDW